MNDVLRRHVHFSFSSTFIFTSFFISISIGVYKFFEELLDLPFTYLISSSLLTSYCFINTLRYQSYRTALQELERALGEQHAKNLEESLRILLEEHSTEIKMIRLEAQRSIELSASETHTRLEEVRAYVLT